MNYSTLPFDFQLPSVGVAFTPVSLYAKLRKITDHRGKQGRKYELALILTIAVLAKLCEQNQVRAIAEWSDLRLKKLNAWFGLTLPRLPHHTTWSRILAHAVDPSELTRLLAEFFEQKTTASKLHPPAKLAERGSVLVVLDGKTLRGTIPAGCRNGVHLVAAYLPHKGVVLAQIAVAVGEKANEITVAPKILEELDMGGKVVAGDAMYAQKKLSVAIVKRGGDYLWIVKGNQKGVLSDLEILFEQDEAFADTPGFSPLPTDFETYRTLDKGHGRIEERLITVSSMLKDYTPFPYLAQVFRVESRVTKQGVTTVAVRYGVTSLPREVADPARLLELVRGQWAIENSLHHRRDNTLREDWSQLRRGRANEVNAVLNNTVLGILASKGCKNVASARREYSASPLKAVKLLL
jgi:predicted transposase YbfD/YdcC